MYNGTDTPSQDDAECAWCKTSRSQHKALEDSGQIHHTWGASRTGGITVAETNTPGNRVRLQQPAGPSVIVVPAPDLHLRRLLLDKGILTQAEYDALG